MATKTMQVSFDAIRSLVVGQRITDLELTESGVTVTLENGVEVSGGAFNAWDGQGSVQLPDGSWYGRNDEEGDYFQIITLPDPDVDAYDI